MRADPARRDLFCLESLHAAYRDCRRRKRSKAGAVAFEMRLLDELRELREQLETRTYRPGPSTLFVTSRPKLREIVAAEFRDRVVHHLFVRAIEPFFDRRFIHDSYACRRNKGTHAAVDRLSRFVRSVTSGQRRRAFFLQVDVRSFFMSIHKETLFSLLDRGLARMFGRRRAPAAGVSGSYQLCLPLGARSRSDAADDLRYEQLRYLARVFVFHDHLAGSRIAGDPAELARVPAHKTLAGCRPGRGLPIGNLTSQFFANLYLDRLDQMVKHELGARYYLRYMDDFVLLHPDRETLARWLERIDRFFGDRLGLERNAARTRLGAVSSGIDFLGYVVHPDHALVRRRVVRRLRERLEEHRGRLLSTDGDIELWSCRGDDVERLRGTVQSYLAHTARADARRLERRIFERNRWLGRYLRFSGRVAASRVRSRRGFGSLVSQYRWFERMAGRSVLFFRVGRYYELYDRRAREHGAALGLRPIAPRPGFRERRGFHGSLLKTMVRRATRDLGASVLVVEERGALGRSPVERAASFWAAPAGYLPDNPWEESR